MEAVAIAKTVMVQMHDAFMAGGTKAMEAKLVDWLDRYARVKVQEWKDRGKPKAKAAPANSKEAKDEALARKRLPSMWSDRKWNNRFDMEDMRMYAAEERDGDTNYEGARLALTILQARARVAKRKGKK